MTSGVRGCGGEVAFTKTRCGETGDCGHRYICNACDEARTAPVVAAEGRYGVMHESGNFAPIGDQYAHVSDRVAAERGMAHYKGNITLVHILPDGAHKAALAAARKEGRRDARWGMLTILRDLLRRCPDTEVEGVKAALSAMESKSVGGAAKESST